MEIKPKGLLPVGLIEGRIATDLKANLEAIRHFVEDDIIAARKAKEAKEAEQASANPVTFAAYETINAISGPL